MSLDRQRHWENVYTTKDEKEVSWFEESPAISLALIRSTGVNTGSSIIDIGGGASRLVDEGSARPAGHESAVGGGRRDEMGTVRDPRRLARPRGSSFPNRSGRSDCLCRASL
jgi:hypothetical protein